SQQLTPLNIIEQIAQGSVGQLVADDLNGDGLLDIVGTETTLNQVVVALNTTAPGATLASFATPDHYTVGQTPFSVALSDLNGDGSKEIITANFGENTRSILQRVASPVFDMRLSGPNYFGLPFRPYTIATGDLNGDGRPDIIADASRVLLNQ